MKERGQFTAEQERGDRKCGGLTYNGDKSMYDEASLMLGSARFVLKRE